MNQKTKPQESSSRRHRFREKLAEYVRGSLRKFLESRWVGSLLCREQQQGVMMPKKKRQPWIIFHDTEGVQIPGRMGTDNPRIFSYAELYVGSNGFSESEVLGSGGFGKVFRAVLPSDGTVVAVKCLMERGEQIEKTFTAELMAVANLRHRNLVRLRGWCVHDHQLLLVYDYMPNRSLDRVLFRKKERSEDTFLTWELREKIVHGLAAALFYLHEQLETQIIHRDVKPSNVMLDSNFNARLGDFGLARWLEHELHNYQSTPSARKSTGSRGEQQTTRIGGTIGYLPPESFRKRGVATAKSDVFSFGIVVMEIASGRRAIDLTYPDEEIILVDWIRRLSDEKMLLQSADSKLVDGSYNLRDMERLIHLGLLCTLHDAQSRPSVKWVLDVLSSNSSDKLPNLPSFQAHPVYISLSSGSISSATTTATSVFDFSKYITANGETMYLTAEDGSGSRTASSLHNSQYSKVFPVVETPREISYKEIVSATGNFSDSHRVAEVDFGTSYHGFLANSNRVIVKRLGMRTCPALRTRFLNEFKNLARLRHRNLVQLRGWCTEHGEMLVVYEYSPNRQLRQFLFQHNRGTTTALKWHHRYAIIKSLASAVYYLHEEWDEQVIHKNIASSAIILDEDMSPRLGSFALAEFLSRNENGGHHVIDLNNAVRGIFGYMAPEYMDSGDATPMADVYSFGVVLLEVVTGRMAVDFRSPEVLLLKRVHEFEARKRPYEELVDWRLDGEYDREELMRLIKLGISCTRTDPELRPSMKQIVSILDGNDKCLLMFNGEKEESSEEWGLKNAAALSLTRRIQALGIQ